LKKMVGTTGIEPVTPTMSMFSGTCLESRDLIRP
jgi:hypothetical protein